MRDWLRGKKTYILATIGAMATLAYNFGWIDEGTYKWIMSFDLPAFGMSLRAGMSNR